MPFETRTTLRLLFQAPERNGISALHEQAIENVPTSIGKQIAEDFVGYEGTSSDVGRYQLYRIEEKEQEKRLISMDFEEVLRVSSALYVSAKLGRFGGVSLIRPYNSGR